MGHLLEFTNLWSESHGYYYTRALSRQSGCHKKQDDDIMVSCISELKKGIVPVVPQK